jgi:hypothetical protein
MARWPLLACLLLTATLLGGCAGKGDGDGDGLDIRAVDLSAAEVGTSHVLLAVNVTLEDASQAELGDLVQVKAYDVSTGFLAKTEEMALAKGMPPLRPVQVEVELPREGTYRLEVRVFHGDEEESSAWVDLRDLSRLQPTLHDTGLRIGLDFRLAAANGTRTDVLASAYLTNEARAASRPLTLQLKARDLRTGLVTDEEWAPVGAVGPDETRTANATLNVALGRDYDVEATLWDGHVVVERGAGRVALSSIQPTVSGGASGGFAGTSTASYTTGAAGGLIFDQPQIANEGDGAGDGDSDGGEQAPGLGLVAVAAALVAVGLWFRRRAT